LEKQGLRLQKSVFVVEVKKHGFKRMLGHLRKLAGKEGKIAVVRLCKGCRENALSLSEEKEGFYLF
jgi:CRISPR-associated endonuclease Cas2